MNSAARFAVTSALAGVGIFLIYLLSTVYTNSVYVTDINTMTPEQYDLVTTGDALLQMGNKAFMDNPNENAANILADAAYDYILLLKTVCVTRSQETACVDGTSTAEISVGLLRRWRDG